MTTVQDKELIVKNLAEHLRTLRIDVEERNSILTDIVKKIEKAKLEYQRIDEDVRNKRLNLSNLGEQLDSINFKVKGALNVLADAENKKNTVFSNIASSLLKKDSLRSEIDIQSLELLSIKDNIVNEDKILKSLRNTHEKLLNEYSNEYRKLEAKRMDLLQEIVEIKKSIVDEENSLKKYIDNCNKEMNKVQRLIDDEKDKIALPFLMVQKREKKLDKRQKNFEILFQRFKKIYKKHYPESDLIIWTQKN